MKYIEKLEYINRTKQRAIYSFKFKFCNKIFSNHNTAAKHISACLKAHSNQESQRTLANFGITQPVPPPNQTTEDNPSEEETFHTTLNKFDVALVELIADNNIPYTSLSPDSWENFLYVFSPDFQIPNKATLRKIF